MTNLKNKIFPLLIAFSALSVSASAAFYSVSGLSKLFAGASLEVIIMASSLEIAKLVIASLLYQYWDTINKGLRAYLIIAAGVLILITSAGIYGFLSAAYQETANKENIVTQQITALETKKALYEETRDNLLADRKSNNELRGTLSKGSTTQYTDKNGNLVVRTNNSAIRNIESTAKENERLAAKLDVANDSIFALETQILETRVNSEAASELGPLKYLSELTGVEMNRIINWLLLIIIFVFDPLAIALVIAANFAFAQLRPKKEYPLEEQVEDMKKVVDAYDTLVDEIEDNEGSDIYTKEDLNDWDSTLMDGLEDEEWEDENLQEPEIEVKMSGEPSLNMLSEEEARFDSNKDGVLDELERTHYSEYKLLNTPGISGWRKKKIQDYLDGKSKRYF
jgi:flagellar basal body-associated protein FliL